MSIVGQFDVKLDEKGRLRLPVDLLRQVGQYEPEFVLTQGMEGSLSLYTREAWDKLAARLEELNEFVLEHRLVKRRLYSGLQMVKPDAADRILINKANCEYAGIDKEVVLLGMGDKMEVWSAEAYRRQVQELDAVRFAEMAERVLGGKPESGIVNG
jgi:MraZ protein